jgi:hypothetical protein
MYLVGRGEYANPGTPYVVALCADDRMANTLALAGHEIHSPAAMKDDPGLTQALAAWEAGDDRVLKSERAARSAFTKSDRTQLFRQVPSQHPSVLSKLGEA